MSIQQPCILLVEDEGAQREVLTYNLEAEGFRVAAAETGDEAMLLVAEENPDLMVLDWMLPNVSGIEICRRVKADPDTRHIPIVMLSARSDEGDRVRGLETGADDYVVKPFSLPELITASNAAVLGATTAPALAAAKGWKDLVTPGVIVGVFGYALGTIIATGVYQIWSLL